MAKPDVLSEKILSLLQQEHLLTVQEMLAALEKQGVTYNKTSVYRSIEKLLARDAICRHDFYDGESSYELHGDHHDHVVCTECGTIQSTSCKLPEQIRVPGFSIKHHHVTLFGICKDCRTNAKH